MKHKIINNDDKYSYLSIGPTSILDISNTISQAQAYEANKKGTFWDNLGSGLSAVDQIANIFNKFKSGGVDPTNDPFASANQTQTTPVINQNSPSAQKSGIMGNTTLLLVVVVVIVLGGLFMVFKK